MVGNLDFYMAFNDFSQKRECPSDGIYKDIKANKKTLKGSLLPAIGVEPILHCWNQILSLARLPIPPRRHKGYSIISWQLSKKGGDRI